ncbi:MFS transporter [Brevibacterium zhoupengii]|uniref:MFS transporter n=1 Tax=Brevibacterium zhoupengii TaxID=2898795 RepID=UPI001E4130A9|nr:MFS transporter [Brevibacterium zhoupengii]
MSRSHDNGQPEDATNPGPAPRVLAPLYAAGFTTAFGAHSIAAGLGAESGGIGLGLLTFGVLLALYDAAEVVLKPLFGSLSDKIGAKPVIVAGLAAFALASLLGTLGTTPLLLGLARLGQGAAASAFSPASSAAVARLAGPASAGGYFGRYGSWKTLGYVLGPLLGALLIWVGGFPALFLTMSVISAGAALWVWVSMPHLAPLPRPRYSAMDLFRQSTQRSFLIPTLALAGATGALGVAAGFLPLVGADLNLPIGASMAVVAVLALSSALTQPFIGSLRDQGRISSRKGLSIGLITTAVGIACLAFFPLPAMLYIAAVIIGCGIGITTPLGFAHLAATTPPERMGRTMGSAEIGREIGDAGGPLIVGAVAAGLGLAVGLGVLALLIGLAAVLAAMLLDIGVRAKS